MSYKPDIWSAGTIGYGERGGVVFPLFCDIITSQSGDEIGDFDRIGERLSQKQGRQLLWTAVPPRSPAFLFCGIITL